MDIQTRKFLRKAADIILQLLFPRRCPVCDCVLDVKLKEAGEPPFICNKCKEQIQTPKEPRCLLCSKPVAKECDQYCDDCRTKRRFFDGGRALMVHDDVSRKIIYDLKYKGAAVNADFMGCEMACVYRDFIRATGAKAIIPIPLHRKRLKERGYNQAELIARALVRFMGDEDGFFVDTSLLLRNNYTVPLKTLDGNRRVNNVRQAFKIGCTTRYESVILIDDIYTTGATINECAKTLKKAGVKSIFFLTASIVS